MRYSAICATGAATHRPCGGTLDEGIAPAKFERTTGPRARVGPPESSALSRRILSCRVRSTRLLLHAPSLSRQKRSRRTLRSNLLKPHPAAKSCSSLHHLCLTSRDFVPWRFSDAGRHSPWMTSSCRRPRNLHTFGHWRSRLTMTTAISAEESLYRCQVGFSDFLISANVPAA